MTAEAPEWLTLDEDEQVGWVGEPELASKAGELLTGIVLLPLLGLGLVVILPAYLQVKNTDYVVTNQSLYAKSGVLSTNIQSLELDKIQNTEFSQSFVEKQLGYGTVGVDTAGSSGIELEFEAIADAREIQEQVRKLSKRYRDAAATGAESADSGGAASGGLGAVADELARTREALENVEAAVSNALEARQGDDAGGQRSGGTTGDRTSARGSGDGAAGSGTGRPEEGTDESESLGPDEGDEDGEAGNPFVGHERSRE